jgi:uncharacterized protein (DUF3084 family)
MDQNTLVIAVSVLSLILLVIAITKLAALSKSVARLAEQIPGTGMTAKELGAELGGSIESSFQKFMPQPEKVSSAISASVETSLKAALGNVESLHKKLLDAQDSVLDKWTAHEKNTTGGLGAISKALDESSKQFSAGLTGGSQKLQASLEEGIKKLDASLKDHAEKNTKASAMLSAQLDKIAAMEKEIDKLLHLQQATEGTIKTMSASEEFKSLIKSLNAHLDNSDKLIKEVARPRTIRLVEQGG